jgi:peptidoglycan/xylan/chitin deacetylase (PgdA/CDA1 family)
MSKLFWVSVAVLIGMFGSAGPAYAQVACVFDEQEALPGISRRDAFARGEVVLTFDDGPQPVATEKLLDLLDQYHYRATFFLVGLWVRPDTFQLVQRMVRSGHEVATHTYSHDEHLTRRGWGSSYVEGQYALTHVLVELALLAQSKQDFEELYRRVLEHRPGVPLQPTQVRREWQSILRNHHRLLAERGFSDQRRVYPMLFARPPGGMPYEGNWPQRMRDEHEAALRRLGMLNVLWHGISGDAVAGRSRELGYLLENMRFHTRRGGVLLAHDRMRLDALGLAFERLARDPRIRVTTLRTAVERKYVCAGSELYAALHPERRVASRE